MGDKPFVGALHGGGIIRLWTYNGPLLGCRLIVIRYDTEIYDRWYVKGKQFSCEPNVWSDNDTPWGEQMNCFTDTIYLWCRELIIPYPFFIPYIITTFVEWNYLIYHLRNLLSWEILLMVWFILIRMDFFIINNPNPISINFFLERIR